MAGMADPLQVKAARRDHDKFKRRRVCYACIALGVAEHKHVLGHVSGDFPCSSCGASPSNGVMVQG